MKLVITVVGKDRVGIIAAVTKILADNEVNILSINQNILNGFFNMILFAEANESKIRLVDLQAALKAQGESIGVEIKTQHQDIFDAMHKIQAVVKSYFKIKKSAGKSTNKKIAVVIMKEVIARLTFNL